MKPPLRLKLVVSLIASILPTAMLMLGAHTSQAAFAIWNLNPGSGDWNTATNWTPATVPNGAADTAIFGVSNTTSLSLSANIEVDGIVFTPGASAYQINVDPTFTLTISGAGITDNSGAGQGLGATGGTIVFSHNSTSGGGGVSASGGGTVVFSDNSTAGTAGLGTSGYYPAGSGMLVFLNNSTAGNAGIFNAGSMSFSGSSTADNANIYCNFNSSTAFSENSSAGNANMQFSHDTHLSFSGSSTAGNATIWLPDATTLVFSDSSTADNANISSLNTISFVGSSTGGTAQIFLRSDGAHTGFLEIDHDVTIGSLAGNTAFGGDPSVSLGASTLTVGSNNLSTTFQGVIAGGGGLTKIGTGTLTFQDRATNNYIWNTVSLNLVSGSMINLNFSGAPDTIRSLTVDGVAQVPGVYGSAASGAPHQLPQLAGMGTVRVTMLAASRKGHGAAGTFDVLLPLAGNAEIECRSGGASSDYQIVATFFNAVTFDHASVASGNGSITSATGSGTTTLIVNLTGVTNAQTITITLAGLNDGISISDVAIPMGVLEGDTNGDGFVNAGDTLETRNRSGQVTDATNFYSDVNLDGFVNSGDAAVVRSRSGTALP